MSDPRSIAAFVSGSLLALSLAAQSGAQVRPAGVPAHVLTPRLGHTLVNDLLRQRVVLFGGYSMRPLGDTWERERGVWTLRTPATPPPPRHGHAATYDIGRRRVVLFGGSGASQTLDDTWEWDGDDWHLRAVTSPGARTGHVLGYDPVRQRSVLFGGTTSTDTWEWNGIAWTSRASVTAPPPLSGAVMTFDFATSQTLLFGGGTPDTPVRADTWLWDGTDWTLQTPARTPNARRNAAMTFDFTLGRVVLVGGSALTLEALGDVWLWDGSNWAPHLPAMPAPRPGFGMAFDSELGRLVVHGGGRGQPLGDTWELAGPSWIQTQPSGPPLRSEHAMVTDSARQRLVLFGGQPRQQVSALDDTWEWDGYRWWPMQPAVAPERRREHAMAFDAARQRTILFGGVLPQRGQGAADTWSWDGSTWTQLAPATSPPARWGHTMAFDTARQNVLLFGGTGGVDTWTWDGVTWTQRTPSQSPAVRQDAGMACDEVRQVVVLYGGFTIPSGDALGDTWEWNGSDWLPGAPPGAHGVRGGHAMAYDRNRQRVVASSGTLSLFTPWPPVGGTWEYDGVSWAPMFAAGPAATHGHTLAYDVRRGQLLLFGGALGTEPDAWWLGNVTPAESRSFGVGCGGAAGVPILAGGLPYLGNAGVALELLQVPARAPAVIAVSTTTGAVLLAGGTGCWLLLGAPVQSQFVVTDSFGLGRVMFAVPENPTLRGLVVFAQAAVLDPSAALGVGFTRARTLTVGD